MTARSERRRGFDLLLEGMSTFGLRFRELVYNGSRYTEKDAKGTVIQSSSWPASLAPQILHSWTVCGGNRPSNRSPC